MSVVRKILQTKIQMSEKLNKIDLMLLSNSTFCGKKKTTIIKNQKLSND